MAQDITLDTVMGLAGTDTLDVGVPIEFRFRISNSSGNTYFGATNGFRLYSTDGATWFPHIYYDTTIIQYPSVDTIVDTTYYGRWADNINIDSIWDGGYFVNFYSDHDSDPYTADQFGQGSDTIGLGGYQQERWGLYSTFDEIMFTIKLDSIPASSGRKTICLDSAFYRPTGYWRWADPDTIPSWDGPNCFEVKRQAVYEFGEGGDEESQIPEESEYSAQTLLARNYLADYHSSEFKVSDPMNELQYHSAFRDEYQNVHVRFQQVHQGVRLFGNHIIVHLDYLNRLRGVSGSYTPNIEASVLPAVTKSSASSTAITDIASESQSSGVTVFDEELVLYPVNGDFRLCWMVSAATDEKTEWRTIVDAATGSAAKTLDITCRSICDSACAPAKGHGISDERENVRVAWIDPPLFPAAWELWDKSRIVSSPQCCTNAVDSAAMLSIGGIRSLVHDGAWAPIQSDSVVNDTVVFDTTFYTRLAIDAFYYTGRTYDWLLSEYGYNSWNDLGSFMLIWAAWEASASCGPCSWSTESNEVYCKLPCSAYFLPHTTSGEIVAHEWCHGVCDATSGILAGLGFNKETDGISEGFPMIMGEAFKYWLNPNDPTMWLIGANSQATGSPYSCYYNVADPHDPYAVGPIAAYYGYSGECMDTLFDTLTGNNYQIGGVLCKWFHLLATGEDPPCSEEARFDGIGVTEAAKLAFRANRGYWHGSVEFAYKEAAIQTCMAALHSSIESNNIELAATVTMAWQEVGLLLDSAIDADRDGYWNEWDNCPSTYNPDQSDVDADGVGDSCDNCVAFANAGQDDWDLDGFGNACDSCTDADGDDYGWGDSAFSWSNCPESGPDNCPVINNPDQEDHELDGVGDSCDNCPDVWNPNQEDLDSDGVGDACCCSGVRGNFDGDALGSIDIADLTAMVAFMFKGGEACGCPSEADMNGDASLNIADLTYLVSYMFKSGTPPDDCE